MNTEELARTLCRLTPPVCRMAGDPRVARALREAGEAGKEPLVTVASRLWAALAPVLLAEHGEDLWEAAAILTGKDAAQVRAQPGMETIRELWRCWDEELAAFFSCAGTARKGSSCGPSPA